MASGVAEAGRGQSTTMAKLSKWFGRYQSPRGGGLKGCWGLGTILERASVKSVTTPQPVQAISVLQTGRWGQQRVVSVTVIHLLSGAGRRSQRSSVLSHGCIALSGEGGAEAGWGTMPLRAKQVPHRGWSLTQAGLSLAAWQRAAPQRAVEQVMLHRGDWGGQE